MVDQEGQVSATEMVDKLIGLEQRRRQRVWQTTPKIKFQNDDKGLKLVYSIQDISAGQYKIVTCIWKC